MKGANAASPGYQCNIINDVIHYIIQNCSKFEKEFRRKFRKEFKRKKCAAIWTISAGIQMFLELISEGEASNNEVF